MNTEKFRHWLVQDKHLSSLSAADVLSRVKRVKKILRIEVFNKTKTLPNLIESDDYKKGSLSIRSQLKRAVTLFIEYTDYK